MSQVTGSTLIAQILENLGVQLNALLMQAYTAKLQAMLDSGQASNLAVAAVLMQSSDVRTAVNGNTVALSTQVQQAKDEIEGGTPPGELTFTLSGPSQVNEGESISFTLTASRPLEEGEARTFALSFQGDTLDGTVDAATVGGANTDFGTLPSTVTMAVGASTATFSVPIRADNVVENTEGFRVTVLDGTTPVATARALILDVITDQEAPVIAANQTFSYAENQAANAVLATVAATDNVGVTGFEIVSGNDNGYFQIDEQGRITLTEAGLVNKPDGQAAGANDFESGANTFTLGIRAVDAAGNQSAPVPVVLNVTDLNDTPPELVNAAVSGSSVVLGYSENLNPANLPLPTDFSVVQGTTAIGVQTVNIQGSTVTLTLAQAPTANITISYTPNATASRQLQDMVGNAALALTNQTAAVDNTAPTLVSSTPADGAANIPVGSDIVLTFSEPVKAGTGNIQIVNPTNSADTRTISITDATQVTFDGARVTINPTNDLLEGVNYRVIMQSGVITDLVGNAFAGLSGTELDFSTPGGETPTEGQTFTLTTGLDNLVGTSGNDTFVGDNSAGLVTVSAGDKIDGAAGTDTFNYFGAAAAVVLPQMSGVEVLNLFAPTATTGLNTSAVSGLEQVNYVNAALTTANLSGITLAATQQLGLNNVTTTGTVTATVGNTATAATLNLSNGSYVGTVTLNGTAIKTLNVSSSGSKANVVKGLASDGTEETVTITGDQKLTVTDALADTVKTVDASAMTAGGALVTAGAADVKFTGGAGDDTITFAATAFNSKDVVDGGAGRDTVVIGDAALTAEITKGINAFTNVEVLGLSDAATVDVSTITSLSEYSVLNAGTTTFNAASATNKFSVDVAGATVTEVEISNKVGELSTTVTLNNQHTAAQTITTLDINGAGTTNIVSSGKFANIIGTLEVQDNSSIVITGSKDLTITNAVAAVGTGHKIDASALTGKLSVTGSGSADIIIGGSAADTIFGSAGKDTITLGAGNDVVDYNAATESFVGATLADQVASIDVITDFGNGANKLNLVDFTGGTTFVSQVTVQTAVGNAADLAAAFTAAAVAIGANGVGAFQFDGNTYVLAQDASAALADTDLAVQLTGLHTLTADNFVLV
ncbi:beta strand repeat-containing protein [Thiorhodospira sibirica]|uniref:beta strand repeat-containing protein n=1 Tax=Thiorhodospira sibirica TaxID=154347 RepID=UPI00022C5DA4|nr:Ig-like domain-containing protein [Thiorhodospira sibirica]